MLRSRRAVSFAIDAQRGAPVARRPRHLQEDEADDDGAEGDASDRQSDSAEESEVEEPPAATGAGAAQLYDSGGDPRFSIDKLPTFGRPRPPASSSSSSVVAASNSSSTSSSSSSSSSRPDTMRLPRRVSRLREETGRRLAGDDDVPDSRQSADSKDEEQEEEQAEEDEEQDDAEADYAEEVEDEAPREQDEEDPSLSLSAGLQNSESGAGSTGPSPRGRKVLKPMSEEKLKAYRESTERRGVVYVSRIPPGMKPQKLRFLMEQYGEVLRVYCTPEDASVARRRAKGGGNRGKRFVDGWVEFADKKIARRVAVNLNNTPIGSKKRSFYHDDLWNIRYLKGFQWGQLTEKIGYERAVRDQRIRQQVSQAKKQNRFYLQQVEAAKAQAAIQARKSHSSAQKRDRELPADAPTVDSEPGPAKRQRKFHQRAPIDSSSEPSASDALLSRLVRPVD